MRTFDAGVDWVTTTVDKKSPLFEETWNLYKATFEEQLREGHEGKKGRQDSYLGWRAGHVFIGQREDDAMCVVSSGPAHQFACRLGELPEAPKISRFDVQITGKGDEDANPGILQSFMDYLARDGKGKNNRYIDAHFFHGKRKGHTLYLGADASDLQLKDYNKTKEQRGRVEEFLRRFEGRLRDDIALQAFLKWRSSKQGRVWCADFAATLFQERGYDMRWVDRENAISCPSSNTATTHEKQLNWIKTYVAPSVRNLNAAGYEQWAAAAMGFYTGPKPAESERGIPTYQQTDAVARSAAEEWGMWDSERREKQRAAEDLIQQRIDAKFRGPA